MKLSKAMENAIQEKNLDGIYASFYTLLLYDPSFSTGAFDETFQYIKSLGIPGFVQKYNGTEFKDAGAWNEEYWDMVASELVDNFCVERIQHLKKISMKVYPKKQNNVSRIAEGSANRETGKKKQDNENTKKQENGLMLVGIAVVIILIIVIVFVI